jgi:D-sedoheptulose 7-phosphate isomerase
MSLASQIKSTVEVFQSLVCIEAQIEQAKDLILKTLKAGNKLLICGNGGSAAESAHFATELVGRYKGNRVSLPAIALSSDGSLLSCIGNDYGYDKVFSRQLQGLAKSGDLLVVISSSGNSGNLVEALKTARELGLSSISFSGRGGGKAKGLASCELVIPGDSGRAAQEAHLFLIHYFCEAIEIEFPAV